MHPVIEAVPRLDTRRGARTPGSHYPVTVATDSTIVVAALLLVPFLASRRTDAARRTDVAQWRRTVTLVAGAIGTAMLALTGAPPLARAIPACGDRDPGLGRATVLGLWRVCVGRASGLVS